MLGFTLFLTRRKCVQEWGVVNARFVQCNQVRRRSGRPNPSAPQPCNRMLYVPLPHFSGFWAKW